MSEPASPAAAVEACLRDRYPHWRVSRLEPAGAGLTFDVLRGASPVLGPVAIKFPRRRVLHTANDAGIDTRDLLRQEAALSEHVRRHGVPAPAIHALHLDEDVDFLVMEHVDSDGTQPSDQELGAVTALIHAAPRPVGRLAEQGDLEIERRVAERLRRRMTALSGSVRLDRALPDAAMLEAIVRTGPAGRSLLHMDVRPANLLARRRRVAAVLDWANALVGDPSLELARIAEYGHLSGSFLAGYGRPEPFAALPPSVEVVYRLDTAVMLANVFHSERSDTRRAERRARLDRVLALLDALDRACRQEG